MRPLPTRKATLCGDHWVTIETRLARDGAGWIELAADGSPTLAEAATRARRAELLNRSGAERLEAAP